jgi:hypothetical protein
MSVIPFDVKPRGPADALKARGLWQRIARALDGYFVARTRRAVPEVTLRRSRHEVNRCRRLARKNSAAPLDATVGRGGVQAGRNDAQDC